MTTVFHAFQAAQIALDNFAGDQDNRTIRRSGEIFISRIEKALVLTKQQKVAAKNAAERSIVDSQIEYLARITSVFLSKMPVAFWTTNVCNIEKTIDHRVFNGNQRKKLGAVFAASVNRGMRGNPKEIEFLFENIHMFNGVPNVTKIFSNALIANSSTIMEQNPALGMYFAVKATALVPRSGKTREQLKDIIETHAGAMKGPYTRMSGTTEALLLYAVWERHGKNKAPAYRLWERRVDHLALDVKTHGKHEYHPDVLGPKSPSDDLHFDAYDAIRDTLVAARNARDIGLLQLGKRLFVKHFDALAEHHPAKAAIFVMTIHDDLSDFRNGGPQTQFDKAIRSFRRDIIGIFASDLLDRVDYIQDSERRDAALFVLDGTKVESVRTVAIDAAIGKFEKAGDDGREQKMNDLKEIAHNIGPKHVRFDNIFNLIATHAAAATDLPPVRAIETCMDLTKLAISKGPAGMGHSYMRVMSSLIEAQAEADPIAAGKNFSVLVAMSKTRHTLSQIGDDITRRILPAITTIRPPTAGEKAIMDSFLVRHG